MLVLKLSKAHQRRSRLVVEVYFAKFAGFSVVACVGWAPGHRWPDTGCFHCRKTKGVGEWGRFPVVMRQGPLFIRTLASRSSLFGGHGLSTR